MRFRNPAKLCGADLGVAEFGYVAGEVCESKSCMFKWHQWRVMPFGNLKGLRVRFRIGSYSFSVRQVCFCVCVDRCDFAEGRSALGCYGPQNVRYSLLRQHRYASNQQGSYFVTLLYVYHMFCCRCMLNASTWQKTGLSCL